MERAESAAYERDLESSQIPEDVQILYSLFGKPKSIILLMIGMLQYLLRTLNRGHYGTFLIYGLLRTPSYGNYGIFLGSAGYISSTVSLIEILHYLLRIPNHGEFWYIKDPKLWGIMRTFLIYGSCRIYLYHETV